MVFSACLDWTRCFTFDVTLKSNVSLCEIAKNMSKPKYMSGVQHAIMT